MKRKLLTLALVLMGGICTVNAQIQKGNVMVGGDLADFRFGLNKGHGYNINLSPKAAWFVQDNVALGGMVNLGIQGAKHSATTTTYGVSALGRYYVSDPRLNVLRHTRFFLEGNVGIQGFNVSDGGGSTNGLGIGFGPGIAYFITPNIGLEGLLKYDGIIGFGSSTTSSNLDLNIGFQIYLPGGKAKAALKNQQ
jgi:hypothetical protein